jgi:hypothetical protein
MVPGQSVQVKISQDSLLNQWIGTVRGMCVVSAMQGSTNRRLIIQAGLNIKQDPISKQEGLSLWLKWESICLEILRH